MGAVRFLAPVFAALLAASAAQAHITAVPAFARAGAEVRLVLDVQNDSPAQPMSALTVRVPAGMTVRSGERLDRWTATVDGREVRWSGGRLAPLRTAPFALVVTTPPRPGAVELEAVQGYPDGGEATWQVAITVTPAAGGGGDDQHLGAAAVVAVVGLAVIGGSLLVLGRLRRGRSLQER